MVVVRRLKQGYCKCVIERAVAGGYSIGDGGGVCCVLLDYCYADLEYWIRLAN